MDVIQQIIAVLDEVRPSLLRDGGDMSFVNFKDGVVYIKLHGACSSCPISTMHLKMGIEVHVKQRIPEVVSIEAVE